MAATRDIEFRVSDASERARWPHLHRHESGIVSQYLVSSFYGDFKMNVVWPIFFITVSGVSVGVERLHIAVDRSRQVCHRSTFPHRLQVCLPMHMRTFQCGGVSRSVEADWRIVAGASRSVSHGPSPALSLLSLSLFVCIFITSFLFFELVRIKIFGATNNRYERVCSACVLSCVAAI